MNILKYITLILIIGLSTWKSTHAGGPWAEGKGKGFVELSFLSPIRSSAQDLTFQLYSEIGVTEKITLKAVLPFKSVGSPDNINTMKFDKGNLFGISNIVIGAKYQILKKKVVLSAGFDAELKTVKSNDELGLRTGFEKYTFRPIVSVGFGMDKFYTYAELKPGFSTSNHGHELNAVAELGGEVSKDIWLAAYFEYRGVIKEGSFNSFDPEAYANTGFFRDGLRFFTAGAKFSAKLYKDFGVSLGMFYGTSVSQSGAGGLFSLKGGFFYDW